MKLIQLNLSYDRPQPPHQHDWQPFKSDSGASIAMILCGEHCACGAVREYRGPAYGWVMRNEGGDAN
jgi:hypothetical protein